MSSGGGPNFTTRLRPGRIRPGRGLALAGALLLPALALPLPAHAADARFRAMISGTFTSSGNAMSRCHRIEERPDGFGGTDEVEVPFDLGGTAVESVRFRSPRSSLIEVSKFPGLSLAAGPVGRALSIAFQINRNSTLENGGEPHGCRPSHSLPPPNHDPHRCGDRRPTHTVRIYGTPRGLGYRFFRRFHDYLPTEPFSSCGLALRQLSVLNFGAYLQSSGHGPVSHARLFNRSVRTIVVSGRRSGRRTGREGNTSGDSTFSLRWKLTLRRVR